MADISTTNKKARVPILGENGRISDAYLPQAVIDAEASSKTYAENAKSYSELVKKDAESAASSAASAKASADAAREGISSIDEKVTQAGQFAEAASSSATEANNYLEQVTSVSNTVSGIASSVAENAHVAETFANESKESAASALTASTNAVNAKVDAEGYRDSAKSYSDNAKADADTAKNILESVKAQKANVDSTVQQFNTDAAEYDTKFNGYVSEARESKEASAASATSASESAENASTSATNASASEVKAKTSADAAALSATNAANSEKEVADNLSLLGASTLTRKEKDTFVHVNDAFPTKLLGIEIEGACKQDGTPSPDNPVPIEVIEHPVVKVTGANLLDIHEGMPESDCNKDFSAETKRIIKPGTYVAGLTFNNYINQESISGLKIADGSITFDTTASPYGIGIGVELISGATYVDNTTMYHSFYDSDGPYISYSSSKQFKVPDNAVYSIAIFRLEGDETHFSSSGISITHVADNGAYAPYVGKSQTFTLPAEHPYLAKLPDGTADEIVVDKDGNVELVARVMKTVLDGSKPFVSRTIEGIDTYYESASPIGSGMIPTSQWGGIFDRFATANPYLQKSGACAYSFANVNGIIFRIRPSKTFDSDDGFNDWLKSSSVTCYCADTEPKTYPLGKLDIPSLPETISNVWTDAEVTPRTGIEYVRDVNIAFANIEDAIASITQG